MFPFALMPAATSPAVCHEGTPVCSHNVEPGQAIAFKYKQGKKLPVCKPCAEFSVNNNLGYWQQNAKGPGCTEPNTKHHTPAMLPSSTEYVKLSDIDAIIEAKVNDLVRQELKNVHRKLDELIEEVENLRIVFAPPKPVLRQVNAPRPEPEFSDEIPF